MSAGPGTLIAHRIRTAAVSAASVAAYAGYRKEIHAIREAIERAPPAAA
jgi:hypothetical protein